MTTAKATTNATTTNPTTTDRIQKQVVLRATPARVWRALSTAREFGAWFGAKLLDELAPGKAVQMTIEYKGKELTMAMQIERMEPERLLSFRWHPFAVDASVDYTREPMTLVEIALAAVPEGTQLTVTESGFDKLPVSRRAQAFEMNAGGWAAQLENIARHVHA
jgi:uncharacterized protein YndB with AHSA1/START domain